MVGDEPVYNLCHECVNEGMKSNGMGVCMCVGAEGGGGYDDQPKCMT